MTKYTSKKDGAEYRFIGSCEEQKPIGGGTYTVVTLENVKTGKRVSVAHSLIERYFTIQNSTERV